MARDEDLLAAWARRDAARAIHPADHAAIAATETARALVIQRAAGGDLRDLFTACAMLGRLLAEAGASPTLASGTLDGLEDAGGSTLVSDDTTRLALRAALVEGFTGAVAAAERSASRAAWEWPACAVVVDEATCAIAAGYPAGDDGEDARAAWAGRVATRAAKAGVKRVVLGEGPARGELEAALGLVGIEVVARVAPAPRSWLPWRKPRG